eukprot:gene18408-836_t
MERVDQALLGDGTYGRPVIPVVGPAATSGDGFKGEVVDGPLIQKRDVLRAGDKGGLKAKKEVMEMVACQELPTKVQKYRALYEWGKAKKGKKKEEEREDQQA